MVSDFTLIAIYVKIAVFAIFNYFIKQLEIGILIDHNSDIDNKGN